MNFLHNLFFLLIDLKSPGVIQGELQLFSSLPLMTFKGKLRHCRLSSIHL